MKLAPLTMNTNPASGSSGNYARHWRYVPLLQTASDANGVEDNPAGNDDSVQLQGMRNAKQPLHTLGHQRRGKAQTGTHREDQGDEIEVVDDSAEQPFGVFSPTSGTRVELGRITSILRTKKK